MAGGNQEDKQQTRDTGKTSISQDLAIVGNVSINNPIEYKILSSTSEQYSEVGQINKVYINDTNVLTSLVAFIRGVQKDFATGSYPANALFYYSGDFRPVATGSATALYELLRGYLYRNDDDMTVHTITSVIQSKTSTSALTGFRMLMFDKSIKADMIKPNSFRLSIAPYSTTVPKPTALFLSNSAIIDNVTTGSYAQIAGINSLLGSLSTGVVGSVLTGFTVRMKIRPRPSGSNIQTLFHRRVADYAMSAQDWVAWLKSFFGGSPDPHGTDNSIALWKYGNLNNFNTWFAVQSVNFGTFDYSQYLLPGVSGGGSAYLNSFSAIFYMYNIGGAQIFWAASANTNTFGVDVDPSHMYNSVTYTWLSLCSSMTSTTLKSTVAYPFNVSGPVTAYLNQNIFRYTAASGASPSYLGANVVIYNQPNSLQKARDLPASIPFYILAQ